MPYEGEFAGYHPLRRLVESERVKELLARAKVFRPSHAVHKAMPAQAPPAPNQSPSFTLAIDGSYTEVDVKNGYPGAKVGYCTVASVFLDLQLIDLLDAIRPADPREFRTTEKPSAIHTSLPGSNVVTHGQRSARASFRFELYDFLRSKWIDDDDRTRLLDTYEVLLSYRPNMHDPACPCSPDGCEEHFPIGCGTSQCPCPKQRPIFSTDALRIQDRFRDFGSNGEAFGLVMQVLERILLIHLLRCFERRRLLQKMDRIAFVLDGPLAVFGPPAWLSAAISSELKRINREVRRLTGNDLILLGVEKSGEFVNHFEELDNTETPGEFLFQPRTYMLLTDSYIKERVTQSESDKRYGADTYFGRKVFYKTRSGARVVVNIPFLDDAQDTLDAVDIGIYPRFPTVITLLDRLVSSRFPNAVSPLVAAHAHAAIPLHLGAKILTELARALMRES